MLTDEQLSTIVNTSPCDGADVRAYRADFDKVIAQAREANALRAQLAEARQLVEAMQPVLDAAAVVELGDAFNSHQLREAAGELAKRHKVYRRFLAARASHQPPTNVPALIASVVVSRVTTDSAGETTMEPATVDECWCIRCEEERIGQAADDYQFVAVEMRAADIAIRVIEHMRRSRATFLSLLGCDGAEIAGWLEAQYDSDKLPEQPGEHAGYLARLIYEHKEEA